MSGRRGGSAVKAYRVWDARSLEPARTVVFAENTRAAKVIAARTEVCENADFIDIRVNRLPEMDGRDRGRPEIDWYNMKDRMLLVRLGWACLETDYYCDNCPCKAYCYHFEGEDFEVTE